MTIFDCSSLYSAYADDTTFFLKYIISIENMVDTFDFFALFRIKTKFKKSGIAGIGVLKGVEVVVCGMRWIDLNNDSLKILGTHFSYNK